MSNRNRFRILHITHGMLAAGSEDLKKACRKESDSPGQDQDGCGKRGMHERRGIQHTVDSLMSALTGSMRVERFKEDDMDAFRNLSKFLRKKFGCDWNVRLACLRAGPPYLGMIEEHWRQTKHRLRVSDAIRHLLT